MSKRMMGTWYQTPSEGQQEVIIKTTIKGYIKYILRLFKNESESECSVSGNDSDTVRW
jgi:hypothetical protein